MSSQIKLPDKLKIKQKNGILNDEIQVDTRMTENKKKDGRVIVFSNFCGCPGKNVDGDDLNLVYGKKSFFICIEKFLQKNVKNKVVFIGNFIGGGAYVMKLFQEISQLCFKFEKTKQIEIVLGDADINILRLTWEFNKYFFDKTIDIPELNIHHTPLPKFTTSLKGKKKMKF